MNRLPATPWAHNANRRQDRTAPASRQGRNEGRPARSAGYRPPIANQVPEGRMNHTARDTVMFNPKTRTMLNACPNPVYGVCSLRPR